MTTDKQKAEAIADKWTKRIGLGFHPDTRGKSYVETRSGRRAFTDAEAAEYDADMDALFDAGDPYQFSIEAMERAKLI